MKSNTKCVLWVVVLDYKSDFELDDEPLGTRRDTIVDDVGSPDRFFDDGSFAERDVAPLPQLRYVTEWRTEYVTQTFWNGWYWDQALVPTLVPVRVPVYD